MFLTNSVLMLNWIVWNRTVFICIKMHLPLNNLQRLICHKIQPTNQKHIPGTEVLTRVSLPSIDIILMQSQHRWAGHVILMKDHQFPKKLLYGELSQGKHSHGTQKKCFKDTLKLSVKSFSITLNSLEYLAQEKDKWREVVKRGAKACETRKKAATEQRKKLRKGTATSASIATIPCSHRLRLLCAQIGLIRHLCAHRSRPQS